MTTDELNLYWSQSKNTSGYENAETDTEYSINIYPESKTVYLAFQGSRSKIDWLQNFNIWIKPYSNMKKIFFVHRGIFLKFKSVVKDIDLVLKPLLDDGYKLEIRGFSQGAGLTVFGHEYFGFHNPETKLHSVAFAPPRTFSFIGFFTLRKRFKNLEIVINRNDLVSKLPPVVLGYIHYGTKVILGKFKLLVFPWNYVKEHMNYKDLF